MLEVKKGQENNIPYNTPYFEKMKKREKIVIHNVDGITEEYKTGILFTLEEAFSEKEKEKCLKIVAKHCSTKENQEAYVYGLAHVVMAMLEDEDMKKEMFHE